MKIKKIILLVSIFCTVAFGDIITIVGDEWCPYNCKVTDKNQGYLVDIARVIFEKNGHTVKYTVSSSWNQAILDTKNNKYNAIIGAYKSDAKDFIFPSLSQGVSANAFFTKKKTQWKYTGVNSLHDITIGAIKSYSYGAVLDKYIQENKNNHNRVQLISGNRAIYHNAKKLLYDTIDVMIEDPYVLKYYFKEKNSHVPFKTVGTIDIDNIYIAFSPNNPHSKKYARILSQGINDLRKNGELNKILSKYGLYDWIKLPYMH
ncbi:transporter substrate-binding domain-containing protein [Sulfurimonas sp. SAG-AH-194-L11]|nr:transporter substrate-binding domain-containing protein [Sulfurimonas sp. SAG-AH-194-L11]MDF1877156.1 transporter substrate-binding domain-containing protein [Sulfurimonas sp. SAG-AH-194-L11]